jgi:hypothetical protein
MFTAPAPPGSPQQRRNASRNKAVVVACSVIGGAVLICALVLMLRKCCTCGGRGDGESRGVLPTIAPLRRAPTRPGPGAGGEQPQPWHAARVVPNWSPRHDAEDAAAARVSSSRADALARITTGAPSSTKSKGKGKAKASALLEGA